MMVREDLRPLSPLIVGMLQTQMTQNGQFVKRGVLTSRDIVESHLELKQPQPVPATSFPKPEPPRIIQGPIAGQANIVIKPPMTADELNETKYYNSVGIRNGKAQYSYGYHQTVANSNFVPPPAPPPPSHFLITSGHRSSSGPQPSQLPIQSGHMPLLPLNAVPLYQSVHKTYIPHHIYNEIPILNSETKYYQEQHSVAEQQAGEEEQMEGADVRMLEEYDKLYQKYQEERESNVSLLRKVEFLESELAKDREERDDERSEDHPLPPPAETIIKEVIKTKEVLVAKPTRVDTRQLVSIILKRVKPVMDETFQRRKAGCLNKLRALLSDQEAVIKTAILRSSEELIRH